MVTASHHAQGTDTNKPDQVAIIQPQKQQLLEDSHCLVVGSLRLACPLLIQPLPGDLLDGIGMGDRHVAFLHLASYVE